MQRFREHSLTCGGGGGGGGGRLGEQPDNNRLEPPSANRIREPAIVPGLPIATVTGTIQQHGVKRHADEGGQKHRVGKGRLGNVLIYRDWVKNGS